MGLAGLTASPSLALPLEEYGFGPDMLSLSRTVLGFVVTLVSVLLAVGTLTWARSAVRRTRALADDRQTHLMALGAKLDDAEAILAAQPDAVFIWQAGASGRTRDRAEVKGGKAAFVNPATGGVDFDYILSRLDKTQAKRLKEAVDILKARGLRFSLQVQTQNGRIYEAEGRPAGGQAVLWLRDVTGERAEVSRLAQRLEDAQSERRTVLELLDGMPLPAWRRGPELELIWVNQAYAASVDAPSADAVVEAGTELVHSAEALAAAKSAQESGKIARHRHYAVMDGARRALEVVDMPLSDGSLASIAMDVTELDETRRELARHIETHNETLDKLATAVAIFGPDTRLKFANRAYAQLFELDPDWLAGEPEDGEILEKLREKRLLPEQVDFPAWKRERIALYTRLEPVEELWHLPNGQALRVVCQQHPLGGLIFLYENVTDQLELETSVRTLTRVQRETLDNLYEGVSVFGSDGRLKLHNPAYARIWRLNPAQLEGEPHVEQLVDWFGDLFKSRAERDEMAERVTSLASERRAESGQLERTDGTVLQWAAVPLPDGATLLTYLDVTASNRIERALRERNEALEAADRLKSEFVSHISYQLRTPLTNIIGFGEILESEMFGPLTAKQHEYSMGILESSNQLLNLINDIIDLATIEAGVLTLELDDVDVAELLEQAKELVRQRAVTGQVHLVNRCPPGLGTIRADQRRIKQAIFNLLSNALNFTSAGDIIELGASRTELGASRTGSEVRLWVRDTGAGIEPAAQAKAFDRFQAEGGGDRQRGAGLGLSLVKSFIELHGGWVTLESTPGEGTTVTCHLPERARPHSEISPQASDMPAAAPASPSDAEKGTVQ